MARPPPSQEDIYEGISITDTCPLKAYYQRKLIVEARTYQTLFRKLKLLAPSLCSPRIFFVNDHGNLTEYSYTGRILNEWV